MQCGEQRAVVLAASASAHSDVRRRRRELALLDSLLDHQLVSFEQNLREPAAAAVNLAKDGVRVRGKRFRYGIVRAPRGTGGLGPDPFERP